MKLDKNAVDLLRAKHCLSVNMLSKKAGVGANTIYAGYERDIDALPIGRLAKALCVAPEDIIKTEE